MKKNIGANAQAKKDAAKARKNAKLAATPEEKRYDLYASIDPLLVQQATKIIAEKKMDIEIKYDRFTVRNIDATKVQEIKDGLKECIISTHNGRKVKKISFFTLKAAELRPKTPRERKPSNNTTEVKNAAKNARKTRNKAVAAYASEYAKRRNAMKKKLLKGKNAKNVAVMDEKGTMKTFQHKRGFQGSNLENKRRMRANKAGQYLLKQEKKEAVTAQKKAVTKPLTAKKKTVVQQEMAIAA